MFFKRRHFEENKKKNKSQIEKKVASYISVKRIVSRIHIFKKLSILKNKKTSKALQKIDRKNS